MAAGTMAAAALRDAAVYAAPLAGLTVAGAPVPDATAAAFAESDWFTFSEPLSTVLSAPLSVPDAVPPAPALGSDSALGSASVFDSLGSPDCALGSESEPDEGESLAGTAGDGESSDDIAALTEIAAQLHKT
jgi:hypothetical protein